MALELNGTTGVSLVQDGVVTAADLSSTLDLSGKTVTLPAGTGGKVINVYSDSYSGQNTINPGSDGTGYHDTGLLLTITPTSTSSRFVIFADLNSVFKEGGGANSVHYRLMRDTGSGYNNIYQGGAGWIAYAVTGSLGVGTASMSYIDSPAQTSSVSYKVQFKSENTNTIVGFNGSSTRSEIIIWELSS